MSTSEGTALQALVSEGILGDGWAEVLDPLADRVAAVAAFLRGEQGAGRSFAPAEDRVFAALELPLADVRVLVVGQDPYPTPGHATGLAFAVDRVVRPLPPSLVNILAEYASDLDLAVPTHGDLSVWAHRGVLLLNRCLTVGHGRSGSHRGQGWEPVTDAIVRALVARAAPLVALLWGRQAQRLAPLLRDRSVTVLAAPHPSPLSAHRGFLGSRPFSRANAALVAAGAAPVDWTLPA